MLEALQFSLLKTFCKREVVGDSTNNQMPEYSKLERHFGPAWQKLVSNLTIADFGCGHANEAIEMAIAGARKVYGIEVSERQLRVARKNIANAGLQDKVVLIEHANVPEPVDCVFSFDSFEHFADPAGILSTIYRILKPGGRLYVSFGPTWMHPLGGHAFSAFPWAHLILSEKALVAWRNLYYPGKSVSFLGSGLNKMTIARFSDLCAKSDFRVDALTLVPIRRLRFLHSVLTQEWTTSAVHAVLQKPVADSAV
jgi:SAM-dependent methyltransferase